jgi:hypothetical protein
MKHRVTGGSDGGETAPGRPPAGASTGLLHHTSQRSSLEGGPRLGPPWLHRAPDGVRTYMHVQKLHGGECVAASRHTLARARASRDPVPKTQPPAWSSLQPLRTGVEGPAGAGSASRNQPTKPSSDAVRGKGRTGQGSDSNAVASTSSWARSIAATTSRSGSSVAFASIITCTLGMRGGGRRV